MAGLCSSLLAFQVSASFGTACLLRLAEIESFYFCSTNFSIRSFVRIALLLLALSICLFCLISALLADSLLWRMWPTFPVLAFASLKT